MTRLSLLVLFVVAGCGGSSGGGGSGSGDGGGNGTPPGMTMLGSREVPGYAVTVMAIGTMHPDSPLQIQAMITTDGDREPPLHIEAALGDSEPGAWTTGIAVAGQRATWTWTVMLPPSLPGQRMWIRLIDPQLNSMESGSEDFALTP